MQIEIKISARLYEKMRKRPLFFVRFHKRMSNDGGNLHESLEWKSVGRDFEISFPANQFGQRELGYCLCIIEGASQSLDSHGNPQDGMVYMSLHEASASNESDFQIVLDTCLSRCIDKEDKYSFVELLWLLDKQDFDIEVLSCAIRRFDARTIPFVLDYFRHICRCLSLKKQNEIKSMFDSFGERYVVYMPDPFTEAFQLCKSSFSLFQDELIKNDELNLFQIVDEVIGHNKSVCSISESELSSSNLLLQLKKWLHSYTGGLQDYNILKLLFSIVSEPIRLEIVKRYFHDIRLGNTVFNADLVMQFKDNRFDEFIRYRYATETPTERIVLTVPLLCDCILALYNSKGKSFQNFDGILDFAMTHCDKNHPGIDFQMNRFIPICEHRAAYNSTFFKGFIDYQLIRKLNKDLLTDSSLRDCIRHILDTYGRRQAYPVCKYGGKDKIDDSQFERCSKGIVSSKDPNKNPNKKISLDCYFYRTYDDKWFVRTSATDATNVAVLNSFLAEPVKAEDKILSIDISMVSIDKFRKYILSLPTGFEKVGDDEFIVRSWQNKTYQQKLMEQYSEILRMRFMPQRAVVGREFDVFGFWKEQKETLTPGQLEDDESPEYVAAYNQYLAKEIEEVKRRTIESLKKELGAQYYNGSFFELPYNEDIFAKVKSIYYFKGSLKETDDISMHSFLTTSPASDRFMQFCAPKLSEENIKAIDIPYF